MAETQNNLSKNQKLALFGLAVFAIFIIGLWALTLKQQINAPLAQNSLKGADQSAIFEDEEEKQKKEDTDGDGLSDWDELNIYKTSPYIFDSDSDGLSDGAEIMSNTDPNCPQGKICSTASQDSPAAETEDSAGDFQALEDDSDPADLSALLAGQLDAASLRKILLDSGSVAKEDLEKISDAELLQAYRAQIASSSAQ